MPRTQLLVGTRKGAFVLESDDDRRTWDIRGPYCESWPVYHVVRDGASGSIYAAAASEWHGSAVWRSFDEGETWALSSEGLKYEGANGEGRKVSKVSTLAVVGDKVLVGAEAPVMFETGDGGSTWTPTNRGLRADWPREHEEVGFCVHKVVRSPDPLRMYQQNHVGMHRSDDGGHSWTEITEGLPSEFGFAAAAHPHDRDTFYVIPLDPGHARCMPDGAAAVWRTQNGGENWQRLDAGLPQRNAHLGVLRAAMAIDKQDVPGLYFGTSTGQIFASADEGESWNEIASYLPPVWSVEVATIAA